jgi:hypothetical protein
MMVVMFARISLFSARARKSCAQLRQRSVDKSGMRLCCAVLALTTLCASPAAAQERWVFVQALVVSDHTPNLSPKLEAALADRRILSATAASTMVAARHSSSTPQLDEQELARAQALVTRVTNAIRMGDSPAVYC